MVVHSSYHFKTSTYSLLNSDHRLQELNKTGNVKFSTGRGRNARSMLHRLTGQRREFRKCPLNVETTLKTFSFSCCTSSLKSTSWKKVITEQVNGNTITCLQRKLVSSGILCLTAVNTGQSPVLHSTAQWYLWWTVAHRQNWWSNHSSTEDPHMDPSHATGEPVVNLNTRHNSEAGSTKIIRKLHKRVPDSMHNEESLMLSKCVKYESQSYFTCTVTLFLFTSTALRAVNYWCT